MTANVRQLQLDTSVVASEVVSKANLLLLAGFCTSEAKSMKLRLLCGTTFALYVLPRSVGTISFPSQRIKLLT